ncbi:hypothetical protein GQ53DRAFT_526274 [Thozetella sp. PMI_491]|nr:hypothetical protein GQ53DRAFT_526274 [Thozetella sp. PMI_491]
MGGSSKFTFPLPGWRHKHSQQAQTIPPPLTKAQKLLGTGEINTDSPTSPVPDRQWGERSNSVVSGISISISDTTGAYSDRGTGLGIIDEGIKDVAVRGKATGRVEQWEVESGVIPHHSFAGGGYDDPVTDASSMRRRGSNSTIVSYYDKSKLPLSISQQTSSSAMAKGLPRKAQALLDMEGTAAPMKPKKKPAKLDLSHLMPKPRLSRLLSPNSHQPLVLGPDLMMKSPSIMSLSPDTTPPLPQRAERPGKKSARETLMSLLPTVTEGRPSSRSRNAPHHAPKPPHSSHSNGVSLTSTSSANLHQLYEHYEQRTMQDMVGDEPGRRRSLSSPEVGPLSPSRLLNPQEPARLAPPAGPAAQGFLSPFSKYSPRGATRQSRQGSPSTAPVLSASPRSMQQPESPSSRSAFNPSHTQPEPSDCGASISSRHTRTSKASKRTDRSITDLDLQMISVLSLSSDSEDDGPELDEKPGRRVLSPTYSGASSFGGVNDEAESYQPLRRPGGPMLPARPSSALDTSPQPLHPPVISERKSSLSGAPGAKNMGSVPMWPGGRRPPSKHRTSAAAQGAHRPPSRGSLVSIPEANLPAHKSVASRTPLQPTPPLSPTSIDIPLPGHHTSKSIDGRSSHSIRSVSSASMHAKAENGDWDDTSSGRFMAVTRQEEMLLAALRQKRAQIRETIIAELEEENERSGSEKRLSEKRSQDQLMSRHSSRSTIRGPDSSQTRHHDLPRKGSHTSLGSSRRVAEHSSPSSEQGQILLMLDRPADNINAFDAAEPSPDLSDFLDFDNGSDGCLTRGPSDRSDTDDRSMFSLSGPSSSGASQTTSGRTRGRGRVSLSAMSMGRPDGDAKPHYHTRVGSRPDTDGSSERSSRRPREDHVKIVEDTLSIPDFPGIPRPDSPISPSDPMGYDAAVHKKRKEARLSAVGQRMPNMEVGWWADDG